MAVRHALQVYANGVLVGGSDSLLSQISSGSFAQLLTQPASALPDALAQAVQSASQQQHSSSAAATTPQLSSELQEVLQALADPATGMPRATAGQAGRPAAACSGRALLDWLCQHAACDRQAALATAQQLLAANAVTLVSQQQPSASELAVVDDEAHWYRLRRDAPRQVRLGCTTLPSHLAQLLTT